MCTIATALVGLTLTATTPLACAAMDFEDHHFPSCTIPLPEPEERVVILDVLNFGPGAATSVHLGLDRSTTRFKKVQIEQNDFENYIVLSNISQTIWEFTGDIDSISRIVALGAKAVGPDGVGIIGVPKDRIHFTSPDLSVLDQVTRTSCTRVFRACDPRQWFGDISGLDLSFHPPLVQPRQQVEPINLGPHIRYDPITFPDQPGPRELVVLAPDTVVSPRPAEPYDIPPGGHGLLALVASGALLPATTEAVEKLIGRYAEDFSTRYRTPLNPDFQLVPEVDYVVTRPTKLPADIPSSIFLLPDGIPEPDLNGNYPGSLCFYSAGLAAEPIERGAHSVPLCRESYVYRGMHDPIADLLLESYFSDMYETRRASHADCPTPDLPESTEVVAVSLPGAGRRSAGTPPRQIDVNVTRPGPVALLLTAEHGAVVWNVTGPQVADILLSREVQWSRDRIVLNGIPFQQSPLAEVAQACREWSVPRTAFRLGPAAAHLDRAAHDMTGQPVERLITHAESTGANSPERITID